MEYIVGRVMMTSAHYRRTREKRISKDPHYNSGVYNFSFKIVFGVTQHGKRLFY